MYFLIPVALFALCLTLRDRPSCPGRSSGAAGGVLGHLAPETAKIVEQIEREVLAESLAFRYHWEGQSVTAADNRQGIPMATTPGEWIDSRGNRQPFKSIVPEHLRGSMELILDRPPRGEVDWVVTRAAFKITKHDPEPRAFLLKDVVT